MSGAMRLMVPGGVFFMASRLDWRGRFARKGDTGELIERGLIEDVMDRMQPFISVEGETMVDGLRRQRIWPRR
jgi:hypothetical protein